jgi:hypothetical protein
VHRLTLSVSDDGKGFDFEEGFRKTGHWGLKNMQERAAQIRGKCRITTAAGKATQIEIRVPLPPSPGSCEENQNQHRQECLCHTAHRTMQVTWKLPERAIENRLRFGIV